MRSKRWLTVISICLGIFIVLALIKFFQIRAAIEFGESFPEPSETVEYQAVSYTNWQPSIKVIGEVLAPQEVVLRTETAGVISKVGFLSGATVQQGDILLQLDVAEEQARLAALEPQLKLAQKDYDRLAGIKRQAVSQQLIDQAQSRLGVAKGEVASIKESIINKTVIAPFDGVTGLHDFEAGEYLATDTLVTRLVGVSNTLWIDFRLPQQYGKIAPAAKVQITAERLFDGEIQAEVSVVEPAFARESRTLGVRAVVSDIDQVLLPGSLVNVLAPAGKAKQVIRLPSTAVRRDAFGSFVFVLQKDAGEQYRAKPVRVTELAKQGFDSFIEPGIAEGEFIATLGAFKLREGILVKLEETIDDQTVSSAVSGKEDQQIDDASAIDPMQIENEYPAPPEPQSNSSELSTEPFIDNSSPAQTERQEQANDTGAEEDASE